MSTSHQKEIKQTRQACEHLVFASDVWKSESGSALEMRCWLQTVEYQNVLVTWVISRKLNRL